MSTWQTWTGHPNAADSGGPAAITDLFVSAGAGNNANSGTSAAAPLATLNEALRRVRSQITIHEATTIHLAAGEYVWSERLGSLLLNAPLTIIGDGAGQTGDDGFTQLLGTTAAIAGSATSVAVVGPLVADAFRGKTIEILTGDAAGDRRTIRDNTTTVITPCESFTAAVAPTDTFRIVEPAVRVIVPSTPLLPPSDTTASILGVGTPAGSLRPNVQLFADDALLLVNLAFRPIGPEIISSFRIGTSRVLCAGVEFDRAGGPVFSPFTDPTSQFLAGVDVDGGPLGQRFELPADLGLAASSTEWVGWGFSGFNLLTDGFDVLVGYAVFVVNAAQTCVGGFWRLLGGAIYSTVVLSGQLNGVFLAQDRAEVYIEPETIAFLIRGATGTRGASGVSVTGGSRVQLDRVNVTVTGASGSAIVVGPHDFSDTGAGAIEPGVCNIIDTCSLTAPQVGVAVSFGGQCFYNNPPTVTLTGAPVGEIATFTGSLDAGAADSTSTFAALGVGASVLAAAADGTKVMRLPS